MPRRTARTAVFQRGLVVEERGVLAHAAVDISESGANLAPVPMDDEAEEITLLHLMVQVRDRHHLARVMRRLRRLPEAVRVARIES